LDELGEALLVTIAFGQRHLGANGWESAAGSATMVELAAIESHAHGSLWGEQVLCKACAAARPRPRTVH
jgi:hypothetical protein